ncbi:hypothetical protein ACFQ4K_01975 [Tistrella bauzanensis]
MDAAVRRYGCTEVQHRGIAGFEIRGIQKLDPMQAAQATAVLWSRVVRARQLLVRSGLDIDLVSQQSGDTLLLWSRQIGHKSDTTLFALLLLVLADATLDRMTEAEAVAEAQAAAARAAAIAAGLTPPRPRPRQHNRPPRTGWTRIMAAAWWRHSMSAAMSRCIRPKAIAPARYRSPWARRCG